jgi:hypothetical protein
MTKEIDLITEFPCYPSAMKACLIFAGAALLMCLSAFAQEWQITPKSDPLTGKSYTLFTLVGKFLTPPAHGTGEPPSISLRCDPSPNHSKISGKLLDGFVVVNTVIDLKNGTEPTVQYRLDDGKLQSAYDATYSIDYQSIHIEGLPLNNMLWGHNLFHKLATSGQTHKFVIGVQEHLAGNVVMQFDMPDATQVGAACGTEYK